MVVKQVASIWGRSTAQWWNAPSRQWMPVFEHPVIPFGTPLKALAVGIPFAEQVTEVRLEGNRIVFDYTEDDA